MRASTQTEIFLDTNVLVYAADESTQANPKRQIARELLKQRGVGFSVQVLNEFLVNARSAKKLDLSSEAELDWLQVLLSFPICELNLADFTKALELHQHYRYSHWDCLILSTALRQRAQILYSEDMQHGQTIEGLEIQNPFALA